MELRSADHLYSLVKEYNRRPENKLSDHTSPIKHDEKTRH
jgi:hypothetical protein